MTDLFCAALLLTALMLIWPQPLHVTIKRALPILEEVSGLFELEDMARGA